jgi:serine/threonine protein phosphatase PrpC
MLLMIAIALAAVNSDCPATLLLVCTDGLFNEVPNDEIAALMAATEDLQATGDALVELALSRGGHDNVAVVVAEVSA